MCFCLSAPGSLAASKRLGASVKPPSPKLTWRHKEAPRQFGVQGFLFRAWDPLEGYSLGLGVQDSRRTAGINLNQILGWYASASFIPTPELLHPRFGTTRIMGLQDGVAFGPPSGAPVQLRPASQDSSDCFQAETSARPPRAPKYHEA